MKKSNILVITGGIGSGKSTVLNLFKENGFNVVNSDDEVTFLFQSSYDRYLELAKDFDDYLGTNYINLEQINKKELRPLLENRPDGFHKAMEIVKPYISERLDFLANQYKGTKTVFEIPLLFESKMEDQYNNIIVVSAPLEIKIQRIKERQPHLSLDKIVQIISTQLEENYKISKANFVINNNSTLENLKKEFNILLPQFESCNYNK